MATYHARARIRASADRAFDYLSDPMNVPNYVPTVARLRVEGSEVTIEGVCPGRSYFGDAHWTVDTGEKQVTWHSQRNLSYHGRLQVTGDAQESEVELQIDLEPSIDGLRNDEFRRLLGESNINLQEMLDEAVQTIRHHIERGAMPVGRHEVM